MHVHQPVSEDLLDQRSFVGPLSDDARLPFFRVHVHVGPCDVHVAAKDERYSRRAGFRCKRRHRLEKPHLRGEILAAIRHVDRGHCYVRQLHGDNAVLEVEGRMMERRWIGVRRRPDVQCDT